ncbi:ShlB/FhaC/HecB family hemolysin secretion/activation protein [Ramlibacter humi]|uniref:ShlB/FhaC/HecB family hemolysin secretion/activation protein n=1 Tax=Ramlibacter humi TaxID=2530451 RepID=A0A4Z0BCY4_9BURK|nr:ShlB/FhaC/HecB family hemolysin secretion/activation protein [Ramlibacter humi]TFY97146.1 ShlB/FhaC/HecB family hemolysin secretion/activation protein [Ramlibacter humi]
MKRRIDKAGRRSGRMGPRPSLALSLLLFSAAAAAQVVVPPSADPGVLQQREIEREQRQRLEEQQRQRIEQPVAPVAPPAPVAPGADAVQFEVKDIVFEPRSEILKPEELEALTRGFKGRTVRLSELRELVNRINELYRSKGVVTASASLPPQDVTGGVVHIRLVEGRVGAILIQGNESTNGNYITDRLSLKPPMLVDLPTLEEDLVRFNRTNDAQLRADLRPGSQVGQTDIGLTVQEPKRNDLRVFADNNGSQLTGEGRLGVSYVRRSLTGRRDDLFLSTVHSRGHQGNYLTYTLPVSVRGTRLTAGYFEDRTKIVSGPIAPLDVTGTAKAMSLQLRHPLVVSSSFQLDGLVGVKRRRTANFMTGLPLTAADLWTKTLGLELQRLDTSGYWTGTVEAATGVNRIEGASPRHFSLLRGTARRTQNMGNDVTLVGALTWQYAPVKLLPSSEQLVIGGEGSVRGYSPGLFAGDKGFVINLEAHKAFPMQGNWQSTGFVFFDRGEVQPFRPPLNTDGADVLTTIGLGMTLTHPKFSARATMGFPINRQPTEPRDYRLNAQLTWFLL